jgi:hypothetical protein
LKSYESRATKSEIHNPQPALIKPQTSLLALQSLLLKPLTSSLKPQVSPSPSSPLLRRSSSSSGWPW